MTYDAVYTGNVSSTPEFRLLRTETPYLKPNSHVSREKEMCSIVILYGIKLPYALRRDLFTVLPTFSLPIGTRKVLIQCHQKKKWYKR